jgi:ligand-binding sensor domain-containing protein
MGDYVLSVAFDSSGNIFAATVYGGVFRSTDYGDHWSQVNSGLPDYFASSLAVTPDSTILVGVSGGIFQSTDRGLNWTENIRGDSISAPRSITTDKSGYIFAASGGAGIYRSTDGGANWSRCRNGLTDSTVNFVLFSLSRDIFAGTWTSGLFRSTNMGESWGTTTLANTPVVSLVEDSAAHLIAGTYGAGLYTSTDNGITWSESGLPGARVTALVVTANGRVFAGTDDGMFLSSNHGQSWSLIGFAGVTFTCLQVGPSGHIIAGTMANGVFRSTDDGDTWSLPFTGLTLISANALLCTKTGTLFAATSRAVFRSTDNGTNWVQCYAGLTTTNVTTLVEGDSGWIFAGTRDKGLYRSKDNGNSWAQFGPASIWIRSLAINRIGEIMAAGGAVWLLSKDGSSWTQSILPISIQAAAILAMDSTGRLYVGADTGGVFISTDNGRNWHPSAFSWLPAPALTVSIKQHLLTGGYDGRINRSTDGGLTWSFAGTGMSAWGIHFLASHPNGTLFAGTSGPGGGTLYTSTDDGDHWSALGATVLNAGVQSLTVGRSGYLFIGTGGAGILKSSQPFTSVREGRGPAPLAFSLDQNFPNPFNPTTTIRFALPHRSQVMLSVFNPLGQRVAILINGECGAGYHTVQFDGSGLSSGVYFYRLTAGRYVETKSLILVR